MRLVNHYFMLNGIYNRIDLTDHLLLIIHCSFVCDKCKECVESKTNLLLLDNGKPVCDNCSYNCTACNGIIRDEAIMTGKQEQRVQKHIVDPLFFHQETKPITQTASNVCRVKIKLKISSLLRLKRYSYRIVLLD